MTDREILDLFFASSEEALPALQAKYGPYCRAVAGRLLSDLRDVEECLSDCWLIVWQSVPPSRPEHLKGWLGAVVRNRALAMGRANGRRPETVDESVLELAPCLPRNDPHSQAEAKELAEAISRFLQTQKPESRVAFMRRYWYADSVEDTATLLGWSVSRTKSELFRTRNRLREFLRKERFL